MSDLEAWFEEKQENFLGIRYRVDKVLYSQQTPFQRVDVIENSNFGPILINDGLVNVTLKDEFVYHEMITHVAAYSHPKPKRALVIGGGDGGTARELARHKSIESIQVIEIDEGVVNACKEFLPQCAVGFDHPKVNLTIGDGIKFVEQAKKDNQKYDIIIVDSTDPIGPGEGLFNRSFYENVAQLCDDNTIVISQAEGPWFNEKVQRELLAILREIFNITQIYNYHNISYPTGTWSFSFASQSVHPLRNMDLERIKSDDFEFNYYSSEIHRSAFALPSFMKKNLAGLLKD